MKILIVGAGASGVSCAINYKRNHPNDEVLIIEHLDAPLKKLLATGNGRCNLANKNLDISKYSNSKFIGNILKEFDYKSFFESISIKTKSINDLVYPYSESAVSVKNALLNEADKLGIKIILEEDFVDYTVGNQIEVRTNENKYLVNKLFFATALKSAPNLGSNGSILKVLKEHKYEINEPVPGLCPIETFENNSSIDGVRSKALVSLYENEKLVHQENGEVLFKKNGLSGIVIFNIASLIARNKKRANKIVLDLLPEISQNEIENYCKLHSVNGFLQGFFSPKMIVYLRKRFAKDSELISSIKRLGFTFKDFYDFEFSQVSVGGVKFSNLNSSLESKFEPGVFFVGELVDVDGPCGGYNLTWAFASALFASK